MADFDPNQVLPGNPEKVSVNTLTKQLEEANQQAKDLARKANNIWKRLNPDDDLKTEVYDMQDFLNKDHQVVIPKDVEEMFEKYEKMKEEKKDEAPSAEQLKKVVKGESVENSVLKETQVKKNPVFDKLMSSFGLKQDNRPKTIQKTINGLNLTFEYPSSLISNFALAYADSESIGTLDFGYSMQLMKIALSIVEIDNVPVTEALNITDAYKDYSEIPARVRKICGVRMVEFLQSINEKDLEKFISFYSENIGFDNDNVAMDSKEFVEFKCPECGRTEVVPVTDDEVPVRYCRFDGKLMEVQSSNKTDENAPLA